MYYKKIVPTQVLNLQATEFICEISFISDDFSSRKFEIEFYDKNKQPLLSRKGEISGLPVNTKLAENANPHTFDYSSEDAQSMLKEQDKRIFDEIKRHFGLTYYDDTFETNVDRAFSYRRYVTPGGELNVSIPIPVYISIFSLQDKSEDSVKSLTEEELCKFINDMCEEQHIEHKNIKIT
jgi:hypothetical protein